MDHRIETIPGKHLAGMRIVTSFAENRTGELWRSFMPRRLELINAAGNDLYSVEVFPPDYFYHFNRGRPFEKWAAIEVAAGTSVPEGMSSLEIPAGQYAVFVHRGPLADSPATFRYIFEAWLPSSGYAIDQRPHFEIMTERYRPESPDSEEEIWVPVRMRT